MKYEMNLFRKNFGLELDEANSSKKHYCNFGDLWILGLVSLLFSSQG